MIKLQVLICTFGAEGLQRIARGTYPVVEGVEYLISWQCPADEDKAMEIPEALKREDFKIFPVKSRGLSRNRNHALFLASAPYCLIADDDLNYFADGLKAVINTFDNNPGLDIATFEYCGADAKAYPSEGFDLRHPPKGYFITSFEIAFRREKVIDTGILFDPDFGVGAKYPAGEEDLWLDSLLRKGLNARFYPVMIAEHTGPTSGIRLAANPQMIRTKGAVFRRRFPLTWPGRMITHALRQRHASQGPSPLRYTLLWLQGAFDARFFRDHTYLLPPFLLALIVLCFSLVTYWQQDAVAFSYFMPLVDPDTRYIPFNSVWEIAESMHNHYLHSTGRIFSHSLAQFFCGFAGQTIFAICNAVVWFFFILVVLGKGAKSLHKLSLSIIATALTFLLFYAFGSEHTFPFEPPHQIDYVWMGALILVWCHVFFHRKKASVIHLGFLALFSFLAGLANESFAVPIGGALLVYGIISRFRLPIRQWVMAIFFAIGAFITILAPGNFQRLGDSSGGFSILHTAENLLPALIIPGLTLLTYLFTRKNAKESTITRFHRGFLLSAVTFSFALGIMTGMGSGTRTVTCGNMILLYMMINQLRTARPLPVLATIAFLLLSAGIYTRYSQMRLMNQKDLTIVSEYRKSPDGIVVIPDEMFAYKAVNWVTRPLPFAIRERITSPSKPMLRVHPESMQNMPLDKDTNMVVALGPQAWLIIRSAKHPAEFYIHKTLLPGFINRRMSPRLVNWDSASSDVAFDSTRNWKAAVYVNERPYIHSEIQISQPTQ